MAIGKGPTWGTPAVLDGLPVKNWKTREGCTLRASLSVCLKRWLDLHPSDRNCTYLSWGPNFDGQSGFWERPNIVGFLMRNGPPPEMGPYVTVEHIKNWLAFDRDPLPPLPSGDDIPPSHSVGGSGEAAMKAWEERRRTNRPQCDVRVDPTQPWRVLFPGLVWTPPERNL